ncbi:hypothetical protein GW819_00460 [Candidatus Gracilibacteria bacterium]|nr:hypothetical protein [Candidatus Gracilibacteria bacterium]OIO76477.1 MAG: hypothetical protein AUJ87_02930 [Candidatus Gracilibacteria bacterium CG1_02_38_174]PIQ10800.1 MAG: hypothetical protein COW68_03945 [Candidatus Gracilibacteria bacterium CG18_big_fil_WC_8_21_14_2_50_38_16]PIQ42072.1 MAG: hypothetical protein COW06_01020 [Candidatus Gracilibacteria bacterium CG12_big_fil_rev_8_21_14_0_65_38_15]PIZ01872.1 MAG: hypothetical protein COY60_01105 [Candidatus Gracilibacteria bacterium CG_4
MTPLQQACSDIIHKNLDYTNEQIYFLYDTESPLAVLLSDAYKAILPKGAIVREFKKPPQPLYRGGFLNPENPHIAEQTRVITSHNLAENIRVGLDHHEVIKTTTAEETDPQIESIKTELLSLPKGSIAILVQSANFRLSTFRIRLELFNIGVHVVEHNHLAYIKKEEFDTFIDCLQYRTPEYVRSLEVFTKLFAEAKETKLLSTDGSELIFGKVDRVLGNTGDYSQAEHKGGTLPVGEVLTEALELSSVHGKCFIDTYPGDDFGIRICEPFELTIENGRVLPSDHFPAEFQRLYNMIRDNENGEVLVRELGLGLNPAPSTETPLSDINFHERKIGIHLSIGKKHGLYGKKLPKTEVQRFHIDIFLALESMYVGDVKVFEDGGWMV